MEGQRERVMEGWKDRGMEGHIDIVMEGWKDRGMEGEGKSDGGMEG